MGRARAGRRFLLHPQRPVSFGPSSLFIPDPSNFFATPILLEDILGDHLTPDSKQFTIEDGEPDYFRVYSHGYTTEYSVGKTQWFMWQCPVDYNSEQRQYFYSQDSETFIQAFTGNSVDNLTNVGVAQVVNHAYTPENYSVVSFVPTPEETYYLRIGVITGINSVTVGDNVNPPPPSYGPDTPEGAIPLTSGYTISGNNTGYSIPAQGNVAFYGAWFSWQPQYSDTVTFNTEGSSFDTVLYALDADLNTLAFNDDTVGLTSEVTFSCTAYNLYYIVVGGYDSETFGNFILNYPSPIPMPS